MLLAELTESMESIGIALPGRLPKELASEITFKKFRGLIIKHQSTVHDVVSHWPNARKEAEENYKKGICVRLPTRGYEAHVTTLAMLMGNLAIWQKQGLDPQGLLSEVYDILLETALSLAKLVDEMDEFDLKMRQQIADDKFGEFSMDDFSPSPMSNQQLEEIQGEQWP